MIFPHPLILADVGGTNVRISVAAEPAAPLQGIGHFATADFPGLAEAVQHGLAGNGIKARSLIACCAGPVDGRVIQLTNAAWHIDGPQVARALDLDQGLLLNDFEAQALSLPVLRPDWVKPIGNVRPAADGVQLILGPGTGLGVAALAFADGRCLPIASEGAHIDVGPVDAAEATLWPYLERVDGRITAESLLSGAGIARLYRARVAVAGPLPPLADSVAIVDTALADPQSAAAATMRLFWRLTARFAGYMAMTFLPRGGVTIAGGILPRVLPLLDEADFRRAFEDRPPCHTFLRTTATQIIVAEDIVLAGMAAIAAEPDRYWIDYTTRCWCQPAA